MFSILFPYLPFFFKIRLRYKIPRHSALGHGPKNKKLWKPRSEAHSRGIKTTSHFRKVAVARMWLYNGSTLNRLVVVSVQKKSASINYILQIYTTYWIYTAYCIHAYIYYTYINFCVHPCNICGDASAHCYCEEQSF